MRGLARLLLLAALVLWAPSILAEPASNTNSPATQAQIAQGIAAAKAVLAAEKVVPKGGTEAAFNAPTTPPTTPKFDPSKPSELVESPASSATGAPTPPAFDPDAYLKQQVAKPTFAELLAKANQGDAKAQMSLALAYGIGDGVPKDVAESVKWFRKAADQGEATAQTSLGVMYAIGFGVPKDSAEAVKWYRKAADQGEAIGQYNLGLAYANGDGVHKDYVEAVKWYRMAADQGESDAQGNLGAMYANGRGVPKDTIEGLAWTNIAAASGNETFVKNRDILERQLGPKTTLAAQKRSKEILKEIEASQGSPPSSTSDNSSATVVPKAEVPKSSGSGAIVSSQGHVLTAAHVVAGANSIKVVTSQGVVSATVLSRDEANDIAVLKIAGGPYVPLAIAPSHGVRLGQEVATIGFPNVEIQGFSPKVTRGEISSLNGVADDPRDWQISVPVQPGNSGGPLLDESGNLIGVVESKLGLKAAQVTGDMPQNVNYAVKSAYALALLEPYLDTSAPEPSPASQKQSFEDMVAKAQQSVVLILVY